MQRTSGFAWQCAFRGAWRRQRQRCALPLFLVSTVGGEPECPSQKGREERRVFLVTVGHWAHQQYYYHVSMSAGSFEQRTF